MPTKLIGTHISPEIQLSPLGSAQWQEIERMTRGNQRIEAQKKAEKKKVRARILYCSIVL